MPGPPHWITRLANDVAACIESFEPLPPVGCHFFRAAAGWEITIFPSVTEIVGGPADGSMISARVSVDVAKVLGLFTKIHEVTWQCTRVSDDDDLGAHLLIEGIHSDDTTNDQFVAVQILAASPPSIEPGRRAHFHQGRMTETW